MMRPDVAFAPHVVAKQAGTKFVREQNRIAGGEVWMKNPAALPQRAKFHKQGDPDEAWWLRHNDRNRTKDDPAFPFYPESPLAKKHFNVGSTGMPKGQAKAVQVLNQNFSESKMKVVGADGEARKAMAQRYTKVMRSPPSPPPPATWAALRSASIPRRAFEEPALRRSATSPVPQSPADAMRRKKAGSSLSATVPAPTSQVGMSAAAPKKASMSVVSTAPPVLLSVVSVSAPSLVDAASVAYGSSLAASKLAANSGVSVASAESVSDFYSWRPKLIM